MAQASLTDIDAFATVATTLSFTQAAERLGVSANAVSLRVRRLESVLRVRLFVRTTRHVALTDEGRRYLDRIVPLLEDMWEAQQEMAAASGSMSGTVSISLPAGVATGPFLDRLRAVLEEYGELGVQMRVRNQMTNSAADGADIALTVGGLPETSFVGRKLGTVTWVLAASPAYAERHGLPMEPQDLIRHRCLRLLSVPAQREWVLLNAEGEEIIAPVGGGFEADDSRFLGDAVYRGLGIGLRPRGEFAEAVNAGRLLPVLPGYVFQPLDVHAILPKGRAKLPRVAACLAALMEAVEAIA